jgi:uncharacterized protein
MATASIAPVSAQERIHTVDLLRGWALLGILAVNMEFFAWPLSYMFFPQSWANPWDAFVENAIKIFAQGKFYTLFSTLFGWGFSVYLLKGERAGKSTLFTYARRLTVLLVIGAIHAYLIWMGDILLMYAGIGFFLFLFRKAKPRTLLVWAMLLLMLPPTMMLSGALAKATNEKAAVEIQKDTQRNEAFFKELTEGAFRAYPNGTFAEVTRQRAREYNSIFGFLVFFGPTVLAMFIMGLYAGRKGYLHDAAAHLPFFRRLMWTGFAVGVAGSIFSEWAIHRTNMLGPSFLGAAVSFSDAFSDPGLGYAFASALILLSQRAGVAARLHPVAAAGRMALTNYLMQSLICTFIFYSHGLGMYGKIGPGWFPLFIVAIYGIELAWSPWWLSRFHFGPAEWLWRTLTYGKAQPMRIRVDEKTQAAGTGN